MSDDKETTFWRYAKDNYRSDYEPTFGTKVEDATHFNLDQTTSIVDMYRKLMKCRTVLEAEFVKVTISTDIDTVPMDQNEFLEERRRQALEKLTLDDIQALGVEGMATYSKLKFHNAKNPRRNESPDF